MGLLASSVGEDWRSGLRVLCHRVLSKFSSIIVLRIRGLKHCYDGYNLIR